MDWTPIVIAAIAALPPTIVAYAALRQATQAKAASDDNSEKIQEVHVSINSRMDQLLNSTAEAATLLATAAEKDRVQAEQQKAGE